MLPKGTCDQMLEDADLRFLRTLRSAWGLDRIPALPAATAILADSAAIADTASETTFNQSLSVGAGVLTAGKVLRVVAAGRLSSTGGGATARLRLKLGGSTVYDTGALSVGAGLTNRAFRLSCLIVCRTVGTTGSVRAALESGQLGNAVVLEPAASQTINTRGANTLTCTLQWGAALPANTATLEHLTLEPLL